MTIPISRRTFLELLPSILAIAPTLPEFGMRVPVDTAIAGDRFRLRDVFGHQRQSALVIGRHYLDQCPAEADCDALVDVLLGEAGSEQHREPPEAGDLLAFFRERFAEDFGRGNTVTIGGWVLSRTEARLCALAVLS
jgi:hypothetical protein